MTNDISTAFFMLAAMQTGFVLLSIPDSAGLFDAAIYAAAGFFLRRFKRRLAAIVLFIYSIFGLLVTIASKLPGGESIETNGLLVSLGVLLIAIRAVDATFELHGRFAVQAGATS